jgi:WD40 repeat protein
MKSPFKFLDSYTREDRAIFFGRDQEITELYRRLFESKMLLVYGISGTGKSSLVNCGLASRFDESDWLPVNVRRGSNIVDSLNDAFNKKALTSLKKNQSTSEKLQSIYLDHFKPVYLLFDQFEELFIFGSQEEKLDFIKIIKEITDSKTQCRIIFIIREEFLAGMTEFESELPEIFINRFRVEKMKRTNAINAVEGPCKIYGIETEASFSEELVDKLCPSGKEIELTYLQIYLDRIFRLALNEEPATSNEQPATHKIKFSKELLSKAGNVSDLLGQFLDEQIREMDDPETGMSILKSFVSVQGTKKQMTVPEIGEAIKAFGTGISEPDLIRYLEKFVELRILRERDEAGHFELRHDALAAKIYEKFTLSEKELLEVRQFVENAYQAFNTRKTWLNNEDLEYLAPYEKSLFLSPVLSQFVKQSKDKLYSQQRALKRLTRIVAVIFIGLIGLGVRYFFKQKNTQQIRENTVFALLQEKVDPLTSINTAFKVREEDTLSSLILGIILSSFNSLLDGKIAAGDTSVPLELLPVSIPVKDSICSFRMNKSATHLYGWTSRNEIILADLKDSKITTFKVPGPVLIIEMSDDAKYFAIVYKNSSGEVFTSKGEKVFDFQTSANHLMNNRLVRFFPPGKYFLAAVKGNMAEIYDSTGMIIYRLEGHSGSVNSLDISPDGRFIVTASSDKYAFIWNFNYKIKRFSQYDTVLYHKDTVWSCEFNKTGKYILTTSADSILRIIDLNGNQNERILIYATNNPLGPSYFWTGPWDDPKSIYVDTSLNLDAHNKKIYDARFVSGDRAIISSNYSYDKSRAEKQNGIFRAQVVYFGRSYNRYNLSDFYLAKAKRKYPVWPQQYIQNWEISPDRQLFAAFSDQGNNIIITTADGNQILILEGSYPNFSADGRYLYYLHKNKLTKLTLSLDEIRSLVFEKRLFGDPETGKQIWLLL